MKLIEKKVPELIWGAKYKVKEPSLNGDIQSGETVILTKTKVDADGDVKIISENGYDWIKPEQLQLITDENAVDKDVLVAGNEYFVTGKSKYGKDLDGKKVTLVPDDEFPFTGEYVVVEGAGYHGVLIKTSQLTPVKAAKKEVETTYVIEFTESELQSIVTGFGATSPRDRRSSARVNGYPESVAVLGHGIYEFLKKEVLQGEDK